MRANKESLYYRTHYGPLFLALNAVKKVLREHPVLKHVLESSSKTDELNVHIENVGACVSLTDIVAGLMSCTKGKDLNDVASRLEEFLAPEERRRFTGYHISVFRGLRLDQEIELSDGLSIAPFDSIKEFVNPSHLADSMCISSETFDAVADMLILHIGHLFESCRESHMYLALYIAFEGYWTEEKHKAIQALSEDEGLDVNRLREVIDDYLFTEKTPLRDDVIDIMYIRPKIKERRIITERIIDRIKAFVETFVDGVD